MKNIKLITRADDAGSSMSANAAICDAVRAGFIKNVSLMAVCGYINEAAELLKHDKSVCFGLHATLNAEWDKVKWKPITNAGRESGLVDENRNFLPSPRVFTDTIPNIETILNEYNAQLDRLTKLGFDIAYVDSHMYAELFIDGLADAMRAWAERKGLLFHLNYNNIPQGINEAEDTQALEKFLRSLSNGQYLYIVHPAYYSDEMLLTGNDGISGGEVAAARDREAKMVCGARLYHSFAADGIYAIRYDEAEPL